MTEALATAAQHQQCQQEVERTLGLGNAGQTLGITAPMSYMEGSARHFARARDLRCNAMQPAREGEYPEICACFSGPKSIGADTSQ